MTPTYATKWNLNVFSLEHLAQEIGGPLPPIRGIGGILVEPTGFVVANIQVPCVKGYNEDQILIVMDDPSMGECPIILGTPTLYRVMQVIKESEITKLATPWAMSRLSWLARGLQARVAQTPMNDIANQVVAPADVNKVVRANRKIQLLPFGHKVIHGCTSLTLLGFKMNVMTHGLEKRSPHLPLGVEILSTYATFTTSRNKVAVVLKNTTNEWVEIDKGVPVARMVTANQIPPATIQAVMGDTPEKRALTEKERHEELFQKLDLSGLKNWDNNLAEKAHSLLAEYHDLFSLEKHEIGHTKTVEHKDPETPPFKECFCRIPPPQVEEVREHLKLMLEAGAIRPSNSPWCNAVVLVWKKDGSLRFCIDFRRLNALTRKDSHPLPRICESLDSLVGSAYFSTFDLTSGFWQVPMEEESKQFTTFTLGSMGLFECDRMPFGLCNAPATFQRLMQNCLGELNLTYCLIYLDDVIVYSKTPAEHLQQMRVVFDRLREHELKLKPSKCNLFKTEIIYLAHHISKDGVKPSHQNVAFIVKCDVPKTYMGIRSFSGAVGHYRRFIKDFAKIAAPLYDLVIGANKDKKSEPVTLTPETLEAFETLKQKCVQAPILAFPNFNKTFLLETDASGKGLGAVLSQKQDDGRYHPVAYASRTLSEAERRYHSNKQEFLTLKWAVTEQFHEYLSPYGKNKNEFIVHTNNNPLTYVFSLAQLDAAGHRWVASLADYNFSLEYQRGKDNTVADFLSRVENRLSDMEAEEYMTKISQPGVQAVLDNAITPISEKAEYGVDLPPAQAKWADMLSACPVQYGTLHVLDWQKAQKEDKALYTLVKNLRSPCDTFRKAMCKVLDKKAVQAYEKKRSSLMLKIGLLYHKIRMSKTGEDLWRFVVPQAHRSAALEGCHHDAGHQGQ